jgi:alcohol dehydrogenase class IV
MPVYYQPPQVITEPGCLGKLGSYAKAWGKKALLVSGSGAMKRSGALDRASESLKKAGVEVVLYDRVSGEPSLEVVEDGIAFARMEKVDMTVGLGGGSAIDTAKAIAGLINQSGRVEEYYEGKPLEKVPTLPFLAIPTTAGAGAEVTKNAVLADYKRRIKKSIRDDSWFARTVLVDAGLTMTLPRDVTASTGSDALTQAIESFVSIGASPQTDALASYAIHLIGRSLIGVCQDGGDISARADMLNGSVLAGMALASAGLGLVHGMAHPLGVMFGIPHGAVCGLLLPYVMEYNLEHSLSKYAQVAKILGADADGLSTRGAALKALEAVRRMLEEIKLPLHLKDFGVTPDKFPEVVKETMPSGSTKNNPRKVTEDEVHALLQKAM